LADPELLTHDANFSRERTPETLEAFVEAVTRQEMLDVKRVALNHRWQRSRTGQRCKRVYPLLYPHTKWVRIWDRFVSLSILLHLMANPLLLAFSDRLHTVLPYTLLYLCDSVFWADIALRFATAHEERSTSAAHSVTTITHPALIASRYLLDEFLLDAVGAIPYYFLICGSWAGHDSCIDHALSHTLISPRPVLSDALANSSLVDATASTDLTASFLASNATTPETVGPLLSGHAAVPVVVLLGTLRARRILRTRSERFLLLSNEHGVHNFVWWFQLAQPALLFLYLSHVCGCLFWYVSILELEHGLSLSPPVIPWPDFSGQEYLPPITYATYLPSYRAYLDSFKNLTMSPPAAPPSFGNFFETTEGIAASDAADDERSVATCYLFIAVWGMINVVAPVWKPETPSQTACMIVVVVCSVANNAAIFGSVVNAIVNITAYRNEERLRRKAIEEWCRDNSMPRTLLRKIHAYYDSVGGVMHRAEDMMPPVMPRGIVFQLELYEKRRLLLELRPQLTQEEVVDLVGKVEAEMMMPGRICIKEGYPSSGLHMLVRGKVHIYLDGTTPWAVKREREWVLEVRDGHELADLAAFVGSTPAIAKCVTGDWCSVLLLRTHHFEELCAVHPGVRGCVLRAMYRAGRRRRRRRTKRIATDAEGNPAALNE